MIDRIVEWLFGGLFLPDTSPRGPVARVAIRIRAADNLCECPACQLEQLMRNSGHEVSEEAFDSFHAICTTPAGLE